MKRFLCLILSLSLVLSLVPLSVYSATQTILSVSSASANRNDTVTVKVNVSLGSNMQACDFEFFYDANVLEIVSATKGDNLKTSPIINTSILGKIVFSYAATSAMTTSGTLLQIQFKVKADAPYGQSGLVLNCKDFSDGAFQDIEHTVKNGSVTVIAPQLEPPYQMEVSKVSDISATVYWDAVEGATGYNVYLNGSLYNEEPLSENICDLYDLKSNSQYEVQITTLHYTVESEKSEIFFVQTLKEVQEVCFFYIVEDEEGNYSYDYVYVPLVDGILERIPEIPEVPAFRFTGWDQDLSSLAPGTIIWAEYEEVVFKVSFVDWDGTILSEQSIEYGGFAVAPENPVREGYTFTSWDKSFSNVTQDTVITAQYTQINCVHSNVTVQGKVESSCVINGYSGDIVCNDCGAVVMNGGNLELADHDYKSVVTAPTPSAQGYTTHTCLVCGDSYVDSYVDYVDENAPQIVVEQKKAIAGNTVQIAILLKNNPGIVSAKLKVHFDVEVMTLIGVTDAGILGTPQHKPELASPYVLNWVNDTASADFTVTGTVATLTFRVSEEAEEGNYPISITYDYANYDIYNKDMERVEFAVVNGGVEVTDMMIGDLNEDGVINAMDRVIITRHLAEWAGYEADTFNYAAADVNLDGVVNAMDRVIITRHLAEWAGYETIPCAS